MANPVQGRIWGSEMSHEGVQSKGKDGGAHVSPHESSFDDGILYLSKDSLSSDVQELADTTSLQLVQDGGTISLLSGVGEDMSVDLYPYDQSVVGDSATEWMKSKCKSLSIDFDGVSEENVGDILGLGSESKVDNLMTMGGQFLSGGLSEDSSIILCSDGVNLVTSISAENDAKCSDIIPLCNISDDLSSRTDQVLCSHSQPIISQNSSNSMLSSGTATVSNVFSDMPVSLVDSANISFPSFTDKVIEKFGSVEDLTQSSQTSILEGVESNFPNLISSTQNLLETCSVTSATSTVSDSSLTGILPNFLGIESLSSPVNELNVLQEGSNINSITENLQQNGFLASGDGSELSNSVPTSDDSTKIDLNDPGTMTLAMISVSTDKDANSTQIVVNTSQGQRLYTINAASIGQALNSVTVPVAQSLENVAAVNSITGLQSASSTNSFVLLPIVNGSIAGTVLQASLSSDEPDVRETLVCPEPGCGKVFSKLSKLKIHAMQHTGERPFRSIFDDSGDEYRPSTDTDSSSETTTSDSLQQLDSPSGSGLEERLQQPSADNSSQLRDAGLHTFVPVASGSTCGQPPAVQQCKVSVHVAIKHNGKRVYNKKNACKFCEALSTNLTKHLFSKHKREAEVAFILSKGKGTVERYLLLEKVRNQGNYQHNCSVLKANEGEMIPWRSPAEEANPSDYIPCEFCLGFFLRKELWRHEQGCKFKTTSRKGRKVICRSELLLPSEISSSNQGFLENIFGAMNSDAITFAARRDSLVTKFGAKLYDKFGHLHHRRAHIKQKMREVARFLLAIREEDDSGVTDLQSCIHPSKFRLVISAVKKLCGYSSIKNAYTNPSLALKIGHHLKKCSAILRSEALMAGDEILQKSASNFRDLCDSDWKEHISCCALSTLQTNKFNRPHLLPLTEDMKRVSQHMAQERKTRLAALVSNPNRCAWHALAKISLANIIMFNRRRSGEASRMLVTDMIDATNNSVPAEDDVLSALSELEKQLVGNFTRVEIRGKRGRRCPVLLTSSMCEEIEQLLAFRDQVGVNSANIYVFARPYFSSLDHIAGHTCLREVVHASGVKRPQDITSTKLRKHLATVSQILNLNEHELEQVCGFLGHDISVHREYYRLPQDTYQLAKVSRLLMAAECGQISRYEGKCLNDIDIHLEFDDMDFDQSAGKTVCADEGTSSSTMSTSQILKSSSCHNKSSESSSHSKTTKDFLTVQQAKAIRQHFKRHIEQFLLPKKADCQLFLDTQPVVQGKSWSKIKCTVRNEIAKRKREVKRLQKR